MGIAAYLLFFLAGLAFGYAAPGWAKFAPLLFPVVLALGAMVRDGLQAEVLLRLVVALIVTVLGIVLGRALDERAARREAAGAET
jgi:hypothetical protein